MEGNAESTRALQNSTYISNEWQESEHSPPCTEIEGDSCKERHSTNDASLQTTSKAITGSLSDHSEAVSFVGDDGTETKTLSKSKKRKKKKKKEKATANDIVETVSTLHTTTSSSNSSSSVTAEASHKPQSNFQAELEWCIGQLQMGILPTNATKSQKQENERYIRSLKSEKTPLPRKRQLMKSLFGDYRTRMNKSPLPHDPGTSSTDSTLPSISSVKTSQGSKFIRRSVQSGLKLSKANGESGGCSTDNGAAKVNSFCFNFDVEQ